MMHRRQFVRGAGALATTCLTGFRQSPAGEATALSADGIPTPTRLLRQIVERLRLSSQTIEDVTFFGVHIDAERRFSYEVQEHRQHAFIRFRAGSHSGWTEANLGYKSGSGRGSLSKRCWRMAWFSELKGLTVGEALERLTETRGSHGYRELEYAETALLDLAGRLLGCSTLDLLQLAKRDPVPKVYCVLTDKPEVVAREAQRAASQGVKSHLKLKLYGDRPTDLGVIRAARRVIAEDAYLIGDVNYGYRREASTESINPIAGHLLAMRDAGLDACEDPANMSPAQWAQLQKAVNDLDLVPDVPLRPAWKALEQVSPDMGEVFNIHPACMGSLIELPILTRSIRSWGKRVMIGDSSLVGPGCPVWQQIAIGAGADWVEAIEKPQESRVFEECLSSSAINNANPGIVAMKAKAPGFGVDLDESRLRKLSYEVYSV